MLLRCFACTNNCLVEFGYFCEAADESVLVVWVLVLLDGYQLHTLAAAAAYAPPLLAVLMLVLLLFTHDVGSVAFCVALDLSCKC